jgi:hypothetical protein
VDYYEGQHDGYKRLAGWPIHRRVVLSVRGQYWLVLDGLLGSGRHDVELPLHFHPSLAVTPQDAHLLAAGPNEVGATIAMWASQPLAIRTVRGQDEPIEGWFSAGYGQKEPTTTVYASTSGEVPVWIAWLVVPYRQTPTRVALHPPETSGIGAPGVPITILKLRIEHGGMTDTFVYRPADEPVSVLVAPGLQLPVGAAWARVDPETGRATESWSRG